MSEENFIGLNIAFRIPEAVSKAAIKLSREIAEKEDAHFVLDGIEYFPHITIYPAEFPENNLEKITQSIETLAADFLPIEFIFKNISDKNGWTCVYFDYSQEIKTLHEVMVGAINPLRKERIREKFKVAENIENLSDGQRSNIEKYGYPNLMDIYEPHLTITSLKDKTRAEKVAREIKWEIEKFKSDTIGIFISGEHGTCRKLLKEFKLGK
jgi:2'-5' RNA ligase